MFHLPSYMKQEFIDDESMPDKCAGYKNMPIFCIKVTVPDITGILV